MIRTFTWTCLSLVVVGACAAHPEARVASEPTPATSASAAVAPPARPNADAPLTERIVRARPELARAFEEERLKGGIALFDEASGELSASDPELARRSFSPASTFKIAHTAIALELGVLDDPDSAMPWDGHYSSNQDWNRDHTLRTAMQVSCVPCFQRVARTIGPERMQEWLKKLDYGNRDASGPIDGFWLSSTLRITAIEQLDFLRRFDRGKLPISTRTLDIVRDVIALDIDASHVLYGKTGYTGPPEGNVEAGWFVGFVTRDEKSVYFATLITGHPPDTDVRPLRRQVTERVLRSIGVLPDTPRLESRLP